jgi:DNA-binding MarR family transcriptional regulator
VKNVETATKAPRRRASPAAVPRRFSLMPTFKLETLASITAKHGELVHQRLFGLRTVECRMLGVVQAYQPVSLRRACVELGIDKSLGSRLVARHLQAGLLERRDDPDDQRSFYLLLSAAGLELINRINAVAMARNREWMAGLPAPAQAEFIEHIDAQIGHARDMLERELRRSRRSPPPAPSHELPGVAVREPGPVLVDRQLLQQIHRQVGELLEQASAPRD